MKTSRLILVTGGARSGKSSYALERCESLTGPKAFVATCPVMDHEMAERIAAHRQERQGRGWDSFEEEVAIARLLPSLDAYRIVLIDCLTLWVNNLMYRAERENRPFGEQEMRSECASLLSAAGGFSGTICVVTNEVGLGIVPDNALARRYRDLVGSSNRYLAAKAEDVVLVSCGIPLSLKTLTGR